MKLLPLLFLLTFTSYSQTNSAYTYDVEKVSDDMYVLYPKINQYRWVTANIIVIINEGDILVVDSGLLPSAAVEAIKEIRKISPKPVKYLLNTHWHGDHWQGNEVFAREYPGLEIISTERGLAAMKRNGMMWITTFYPKYFQLMMDGYDETIKKGKGDDGKLLDEKTLAEMKEGNTQVKQDLENVRKISPTFPTVTFSDKLVLKRGNRIFEFHYLGIGNTMGDAVLYLPNEKVLIAGDLVVHPSPYESGAFSMSWIETSKKLKDFDFKLLIPGHGEIQKNSDYLDYLNVLFSEVSRQMNDAYLNGKTNAEEASKVVTTESVVRELSKTPRFVEFAKKLEPDFVPAAIKSSYRQAAFGAFQN